MSERVRCDSSKVRPQPTGRSYKPRAQARGLRAQTPPFPLTHTSPGRKPGDCGHKRHPAIHSDTRPRGAWLCLLERHVTVPQLALGGFYAAGAVATPRSLALPAGALRPVPQLALGGFYATGAVDTTA